MEASILAVGVCAPESVKLVQGILISYVWHVFREWHFTFVNLALQFL